jgi:rhodanese-related sulfurtransferase
VTIDEQLDIARSGLERVDPKGAAAAHDDGALLVDIRPIHQRSADGEIPGAIVIDRNVLEWRLDPASPDRIPEVEGYDQSVILFCNEGYASSLAAASLQAVGLGRATDLDGGYQAWRAAGLPTTPPRER